jgi:NTE family protein
MLAKVMSKVSEMHVAVTTTPEPTPRPAKTPRIGVALGGGSARGYAHIGALAALERHNLRPDVITGTSFGAVIGALYATGKPVAQLVEEATGLRRRDIFPHITDFGLHQGALFRGDKLEAYFDRLLEGRAFSDLAYNLIVVTTDIDTGECVYLNSGNLAKALRASASMPGIFAPVDIGGRRLLDGGLAAPVPLHTLQPFEVDIGIGIGAGLEGDNSRAVQLARQFLNTETGGRVHRLLRNSRSTHVLARLGKAFAHTASSWIPSDIPADALQVHTQPPISWLHFHRAEHAIIAGEKALEAFMPRIHSAVAQFTAVV